MTANLTRRNFLRSATLGAAATTVVSAGAVGGQKRNVKTKVLGIACSPRKGKTTAQALGIALDATREFAPDGIDIELIELAGLMIPSHVVAGIPLEDGQRDDFPQVAEKLSDPAVAGLLIGTPVYFANMTSLCKAFIERCGVFRKNNFALSGKIGGVVAVGGVRSGGQELVIQSVQAALLCHEMQVIGDGRPTGHFGARLWNDGSDDISGDSFGVETARNLGRHMAEVVMAQSGN